MHTNEARKGRVGRKQLVCFSVLHIRRDKGHIIINNTLKRFSEMEILFLCLINGFLPWVNGPRAHEDVDSSGGIVACRNRDSYYEIFIDKTSSVSRF